MSFILAVAQYKRGRDAPDGAEHWALVTTSPSAGSTQAYEILGNTDSYVYRTKQVDLTRSSSLQGGVVVGKIPEANIEWLKTFKVEHK